MKNEEIDQLTKDLLAKSAPKVSDHFEMMVMAAIEVSPETSLIRNYRLSFALFLIATVALGCIFVFLNFTGFTSIQPASLSGFLKYFRIDVSILPVMDIAKVAIALSSATYILILFDIYLKDFFGYKQFKQMTI